MLTSHAGLMAGSAASPRHNFLNLLRRVLGAGALVCMMLILQGPMALAQVQGNLAPTSEPAGEANLKLPDLSSVDFLGMNGHALLLVGLIFCVLGLLFGLGIYMNLKNLPVHRAMREISELIYETCKTYLITQGKFIALLWVFIAVIIGLYFGILAPIPGHPVALTLTIILAFSIIGILGSY